MDDTGLGWIIIGGWSRIGCWDGVVVEVRIGSVIEGIVGCGGISWGRELGGNS